MIPTTKIVAIISMAIGMILLIIANSQTEPQKTYSLAGVGMLILSILLLLSPSSCNSSASCPFVPTTEDDYQKLYTPGATFLNYNSATDSPVLNLDGKIPGGADPTWKTCIEACKSNPMCGGVTFNTDKKICYMSQPGKYWGMSGAPGDNAWSYNAPPPRPAMYQGFDYNTLVPTEEIAQVGATKPADCQAACTANTNCKAWSWNSDPNVDQQRNCWLKSNFVYPPRVSVQGSYTGNR